MTETSDKRSKLYIFCAAFIVAAVFVLSSFVPVNASASVAPGDTYIWGTGGTIPFTITGSTMGETITITVRVAGTLHNAYDSAGNTATLSDNYATCVYTITDIYDYNYSITVEGEDITGVYVSRIGFLMDPASPTAEQPQPADPSGDNPEQAPPAEVQPSESDLAAVETEPAQTAAPAQTQAASAETTQAAPAATTQAAQAAQADQDDAEETSGSYEEEEPRIGDGEAEVGETTQEVIIMDAEGNLVRVTPTPTTPPRPSNIELKFSDEVELPLKWIIAALVIIGVIGTRCVLLKIEGLSGSRFLLAFIPGVEGLVDSIERKKAAKWKAEHEAQRPVLQAEKENASANFASARAAEAAREAQLARAEFIKAEQERKAAAASRNAVAPHEVKSSTAVYKQKGGVPLKSDFMFTTPVPGRNTAMNQAPSPFKPSPFKQNTAAGTNTAPQPKPAFQPKAAPQPDAQTKPAAQSSKSAAQADPDKRITPPPRPEVADAPKHPKSAAGLKEKREASRQNKPKRPIRTDNSADKEGKGD